MNSYDNHSQNRLVITSHKPCNQASGMPPPAWRMPLAVPARRQLCAGLSRRIQHEMSCSAAR